MATLTETAFHARRAIKWGIIAFIGFLILRLLLIATFDAIRQAFPAPPLKPNNLFGKIPRPIFSTGASPSGELSFSLQTISGTVPVASEAARVYFMPKNRVNLLSLSKAQTFVGRLGFTSTPRELTETSYRWIDLKSPLRTVEMDVVSNHFTLSYAFIHDLPLFAEKNIPNKTSAITEVQTFLQTLGLSLPDIALNSAENTFLKLVGDKLETTTSQSLADAIRLDFFRKGFDGLPIVTDQPGISNITFIMSGSRKNDKRILKAEYRYWPIDTKSFAAYKLKTSQFAYDELKAGQAHFVKLPTNSNQITITNIYLAYFDGIESQLYLQPVFVFEGENNFLAYVSAIAPPWVE